MRFCKRPFENLEIGTTFDTYTCCAWYINSYSIGNILNTNFDKVWNSEEAQNFRKKILNGDYSLCNTKKCCEYEFLPNLSKEEIEQKYSPVMQEYPKVITLGYDRTCNARCCICRDNCVENNEFETEKLNKLADENLIPLFQSAEKIVLSGAGEAFYSKHSRYLINKLTKMYPEMKFEIYTNGLLCNEENIKDLGLVNKISRLSISIHAVKKETYQKIVRAGSFDIIKKNLKSLQQMLKRKEIEEIQLVFIVSSLNYKEMPAFVDFAKKFNMQPVFCEYVPVNDTEMYSKAEDYLIHLPSHPKHKDFLKVLKNKKLTGGENCFLNPLLADLKYHSKI